MSGQRPSRTTGPKPAGRTIGGPATIPGRSDQLEIKNVAVLSDFVLDCNC